MDLDKSGIVPRKRRHGNTTDSSIIQFAKPDFLNEEREDDLLKNAAASCDSESSASGDDASKALTWSDSPPRQPAKKSYERQPRRKMRDEGRAEIEMAKEIARREEQRRSDKSKAVKEKETKERKKIRQRKSKEGGRSRRALGEKPSNILHQAFESEHVTKDRLTLKPSLGLFKKGKASLPARGLPDLVFSEMQFLGRQSSRIAESTGEQHQTHARKADETVSSYFTQKRKKKEKPKPKSPDAGFQRRSKGSKSVLTTASTVLDASKHSKTVDAHERENQQRRRDPHDPSLREHNGQVAARSVKLASAEVSAHLLHHQGRDAGYQQDNIHEARHQKSQQESKAGNSHIYMSSDELDSQYVRMRKEHAENVVTQWLENPEEISRPFRYPTSEIQEIENEWTKPLFGGALKQNTKEQFYVDPICPEPGRLFSPDMSETRLGEYQLLDGEGAQGMFLKHNLGEQNKRELHERPVYEGENIGSRSPREKPLNVKDPQYEDKRESRTPKSNVMATYDGRLPDINQMQRYHVIQPGIEQQPVTFNTRADLLEDATAPEHFQSSNKSLPNLPVPSKFMNEPARKSPIPTVQINGVEETSSGFRYGTLIDQAAHSPDNLLERPYFGAIAGQGLWQQQQQRIYYMDDEAVHQQMNQIIQQQIPNHTVENARTTIPTYSNHFSTSSFINNPHGFENPHTNGWNDEILQRPQSVHDSAFPLQGHHHNQHESFDVNDLQRMEGVVYRGEDERILEDNLSPLRVEDLVDVYMTPQETVVEEDPWMLNLPLGASEANFSMSRNPAFRLQNSRVSTAPQGNVSRKGYRRLEAMNTDVQDGLILPQRRQLFGLRQDVVANVDEGDPGPKMFWRPRKTY